MIKFSDHSKHVYAYDATGKNPFVWICYPDAFNISICNALNIQKAESFFGLQLLILSAGEFLE